MSDDPRSALVALADRHGVSLAALSAMLGRNAAYLQQFVRRGTPRALAEQDRARLARFFGVGEAALGGPADPPAPWRIPRLAIAASAGPGTLVDTEVVEGSELLSPDLARRLRLVPGHAAMLRVRGDSMRPGLLDGDHILVDTADRRVGAQGAVFVVAIDAMVMVKRVARVGDRLIATSDNPDALPVPDAPIAVIGRVVWQMRVPT